MGNFCRHDHFGVVTWAVHVATSLRPATRTSVVDTNFRSCALAIILGADFGQRTRTPTWNSTLNPRSIALTSDILNQLVDQKTDDDGRSEQTQLNHAANHQHKVGAGILAFLRGRSKYIA